MKRIQRNFHNSARYEIDELGWTLKRGTPKFRKMWIKELVKKMDDKGLLAELSEAVREHAPAPAGEEMT